MTHFSVPTCRLSKVFWHKCLGTESVTWTVSLLYKWVSSTVTIELWTTTVKASKHVRAFNKVAILKSILTGMLFKVLSCSVQNLWAHRSNVRSGEESLLNWLPAAQRRWLELSAPLSQHFLGFLLERSDNASGNNANNHGVGGSCRRSIRPQKTDHNAPLRCKNSWHLNKTGKNARPSQFYYSTFSARQRQIWEQQ